MSKRINYIIAEIVDQYYYSDNSSRPWVIGFSGGKDSTVLLQLVWKALEQVKKISQELKREVYVVCNDTMVENPIISNYVNTVLDQIRDAAQQQQLSIEVQKTHPRLEDSFWVNLIGKGYPTPNNTFRWCTSRLKIKPTSRFIIEQFKNYKDGAVVLLGTRRSESTSRYRSIQRHSVNGERLSRHSELPNVFTYSPIVDLMLEEVWYILNTMPSPWGADNDKLFQIYADASADDYECPTMVANKKRSSCGQSRFGCWVCTVVKEDKSMTALVNSGQSWLKPLLDFRNRMVAERLPQNRMLIRRNGQKGKGPYTPNYRASLLKRLLEMQKDLPNLKLITNQELMAIQITWYRDLIFGNKVSEIYHSVYQRELDVKNCDESYWKEEDLLKKVCGKDTVFIELIQDHLTLLKNKTFPNRKKGLKDALEKRIEGYLKQT